jgi:hypothetical protein
LQFLLQEFVIVVVMIIIVVVIVVVESATMIVVRRQKWIARVFAIGEERVAIIVRNDAMFVPLDASSSSSSSSYASYAAAGVASPPPPPPTSTFLPTSCIAFATYVIPLLLQPPHPAFGKHQPRSRERRRRVSSRVS